ncbi:Tetracycline repressor protein class E [compost metagenome]
MSPKDPVEFSGRGDPQTSMALLWGESVGTRRGPKRRMTVNDVTRAALELADAEGLDALSMRHLADALGVTPMTLYTYVPGKAELLDLMVDAALGEGTAGGEAHGDMRARLEAIARQNQDTYRRHPWLLQISPTRPVLGPHGLAKYERELCALDGLGLSDLDMDAVLTLVNGYVHGAMRSAYEAAEAVRRTGMSDAEWWEAYAPHLAAAVDPARFPLASRVGTAAGQAHGGPFSADHAFEFGLQRVLDGIAHFVASRPAPPAD